MMPTATWCGRPDRLGSGAWTVHRARLVLRGHRGRLVRLALQVRLDLWGNGVWTAWTGLRARMALWDRPVLQALQVRLDRLESGVQWAILGRAG